MAASRGGKQARRKRAQKRRSTAASVVAPRPQRGQPARTAPDAHSSASTTTRARRTDVSNGKPTGKPNAPLRAGARAAAYPSAYRPPVAPPSSAVAAPGGSPRLSPSTTHARSTLLPRGGGQGGGSASTTTQAAPVVATDTSRVVSPSAAPFSHVWRGVRAVWRRTPGWARDGGLWLTLAVAALLRIPPLARSPFTGDDALLLLEAARSVHDGLLPATGIFSSLLALNMPLYTWLLLPFAAHPLGMAMLTGVTNVAAVGALYLLGARYLSRTTGLIAGLLFGVATYPVWMSLFIWQQTLVPPFLLAVLWTLFLGAVDGKRHWLPIHTLLLAALIQIYPLTATLLPLTVVGMAFGWRVRHWDDLLDLPLAALGPALIFTPTILFELASGGYDIRIYRAYLYTPAHVDGQVFELLRQAIGALPADYLGAGTPYAQVAPHFGWLGALLLALWAVSALWLFASLLFPRLAGSARSHSMRRSRTRGMRPGVGVARSNHSVGANWRNIWRNIWRGVGRTLGDRGWRARLLIFLWPPFFLAVTVRHASPIYIHYAFIVLPIGYLTIGWALARLPRLLAGLGGGLLVVAQGVVTTAFALTLVTGQATAGSWGGVPIASYAQATSLTASAAQRARGAVGATDTAQALIASDPGDPYMGLYWALRGNMIDRPTVVNWVSVSSQSCALTPPRAAGPGALLVMATPGLALADQLASPGARLIRRIPMARGATYPLYQIAPNTAALDAPGTQVNGELRLDGARLAPAAQGLPTRIVTRWTALTATPPGPAVFEYTFHFLLAAPGRATAQVWLTCAPSVWARGEGVELAFPLPAGFTESATPQVSVIVSRDTHSWYQPRIHGLTLETAKELTQQDMVVLPIGATQGSGIARPTQQAIEQATLAVSLAP